MKVEELINNITVLANKANKAGLFDINESLAVGQTIKEVTDLIQNYELIEAELKILKEKKDEN